MSLQFDDVCMMPMRVKPNLMINDDSNFNSIFHISNGKILCLRLRRKEYWLSRPFTIFVRYLLIKCEKYLSIFTSVDFYYFWTQIDWANERCTVGIETIYSFFGCGVIISYDAFSEGLFATWKCDTFGESAIDCC